MFFCDPSCVSPGLRCNRYVHQFQKHVELVMVAAFIITCCSSILPFASASLACTNTSFCESKYREGSICKNDFCTNPFESGCLRTKQGKNATLMTRDNFLFQLEKRVCNSHDSEEVKANGNICRNPTLNYTEVRILFADYESAMFLSWIYQILLSEVVGVPVSLDKGAAGKFNSSFYDPNNTVDYATDGYSFEPLKKASEVEDCRNTNESCAHFMPEAWGAIVDNSTKLQHDNIIDHPEETGMIGHVTYYMPKFTGERDSSLMTYFGLKGEKNRRKLAAAFLAPTTWNDYCMEVSKNNCKEDDGIAKRHPKDKEKGKYFDAENYKGHFRNTSQNDCDNNSKCSGHIVDADCYWSTNTVQQIYWNDIALASNQPDGYSQEARKQILYAADATKSNVMIVWWSPEPRLDMFDFIPVTFPPVNVLCLKNRVIHDDKCSGNITRQRGKKEGSCGPDSVGLKKIFVSKLRQLTEEQSEAERSPAYEILRNFQMKETTMSTILDKWILLGNDTNGFNPREAVCSWVHENIDDLMRIVPYGYPRIVKETSSNDAPYKHVAIAFACVVAVAVLVSSALTYCWRLEKAIKFAQVQFLYMMLLGLFFMSISGIICALEPSLATCTTKWWFILIGTAFVFIPMLVKVEAINHIERKSRKAKRVRISQKQLYGTVAVPMGFIIIFLVVWSLVDPPKSEEEKVLVGERNVEIDKRCSTDSQIWYYIVAAFELVLLLSTVVLAFQTRNVRQEFNESQSLANLAYSNLIWVIMVLLIGLLIPESAMKSNLRDSIISFFISGCTLFSLMIYIFPKFLRVIEKVNENAQRGVKKTKVNRSSQGTTTQPTPGATTQDTTTNAL